MSFYKCAITSIRGVLTLQRGMTHLDADRGQDNRRCNAVRFFEGIVAMCNNTDQFCVFLDFVDTIIERPYWVQVLFTVFMCTIFLVGVTGNLITCFVIYCDRSMHTVMNYYLFNLAVSDLTVAFGIFLELDLLMNQTGLENYGDVICQVEFFLIVALWNNSILIMTAMAIERYIAIWHPLLLDRGPAWRRIMKIMIVIWTLAILEALPEIWTVRFTKIGSTGLCYILPTTFARILNGILGLVTFVFPLIIMVSVYTMVAFKVNVSLTSYSPDKVFNHRRSSSKINGLIIALTLSFLVCWMPFFVMRVIIVIADWKWTRNFVKNWDTMLMLCSCNSWFSIVLNPLLFSVMSTKFKKAFKNLWNTKVRRMDSSTIRTRSSVI